MYDSIWRSRRVIPLAWGALQPHLVLPAMAVGWDDQRLHAVLLHELAHIKRHDLLVLLLSRIACALYWFNPLVWLAAWRLQIECERACDDLVLKAGMKPSDYAEQLLQISTEHESTRWPGALAMALPGHLEGRVVAVLDRNLRRSAVPRRFGVAISLLAIALLVPLAMLRVAKADSPASEITNVKLPTAAEPTKSDRAGMLRGQGARVPPYEVDGSIS